MKHLRSSIPGTYRNMIEGWNTGFDNFTTKSLYIPYIYPPYKQIISNQVYTCIQLLYSTHYLPCLFTMLISVNNFNLITFTIDVILLLIKPSKLQCFYRICIYMHMCMYTHNYSLYTNEC